MQEASTVTVYEAQSCMPLSKPYQYVHCCSLRTPCQPPSVGGQRGCMLCASTRNGKLDNKPSSCAAISGTNKLVAGMYTHACLLMHDRRLTHACNTGPWGSSPAVQPPKGTRKMWVHQKEAAHCAVWPRLLANGSRFQTNWTNKQEGKVPGHALGSKPAYAQHSRPQQPRPTTPSSAWQQHGQCIGGTLTQQEQKNNGAPEMWHKQSRPETSAPIAPSARPTHDPSQQLVRPQGVHARGFHHNRPSIAGMVTGVLLLDQDHSQHNCHATQRLPCKALLSTTGTCPLLQADSRARTQTPISANRSSKPCGRHT